MSFLLDNIAKLFLQMINPIDFPWEGLVAGLKNGIIDQPSIINATINNPWVQCYSPSRKYIQTFLKRLLSEFEINDIEVVGEIYAAYANLVTQADQKEEFHYCCYQLHHHLKITLKETRSFVIDGTTGLTTWTASHVLVEYILQNGVCFKSKKVLELGSGLGLVGLALVKTCSPESYTFTDHHLKVLDYLKHNINLNLPSSQEINENIDSNAWHWQGSAIRLTNLDWELPHPLEKHHYIIGADILFDSRLIPHIVSILRASLVPEGRVILAATIRHEKTFEDFITNSSHRGFMVEWLEEKKYQESASRPKELVKVVSLSLYKEKADLL